MGWGPKKPQRSEALFEFLQVGAQMRVAAIDAATGTEVAILAPLTATQAHMQAVALAKLNRALVGRRPGRRF